MTSPPGTNQRRENRRQADSIVLDAALGTISVPESPNRLLRVPEETAHHGELSTGVRFRQFLAVNPFHLDITRPWPCVD